MDGSGSSCGDDIPLNEYIYYLNYGEAAYMNGRFFIFADFNMSFAVWLFAVFFQFFYLKIISP